MVSSSNALAHLLIRFALLMALVVVASSSPRPHFGDANQEDGRVQDEDFNINIEDPSLEDYYYYYLNVVPDDDRRFNPNDNLAFLSALKMVGGDEGETLLRKIYKRMGGNSRYPDGIYRRNGIDKKIKSKSTGFTPIRCLVNPVTCFK